MKRYPVVERLTMCVWLPFASKQPCEAWLWSSDGQNSITNSSGTQLSSDSFHSAAWPQAPFLKWTQASSCPWTQGTLSKGLFHCPQSLQFMDRLKTKENPLEINCTQPESQCKIHIIKKAFHYLVAWIKQHLQVFLFWTRWECPPLSG